MAYKETELTNWLQITKSVTTPAFYRGKIDAYDQKLGQTALLVPSTFFQSGIGTLSPCAIPHHF